MKIYNMCNYKLVSETSTKEETENLSEHRKSYLFNAFKALCKGSGALENFCKSLVVKNTIYVDFDVVLMLHLYKKECIENKFCIVRKHEPCSDKCRVQTYEVHSKL